MKTAFLAFVLVLLSTVQLMAFVKPVVAEETIYIRADGSVEGTDKIQVHGSHYILTGNITVDTLLVDGIYVEKDNIVIDGSGYVLEGNAEGVGIHLYQRRGVVIKNFHITNWYCGLSNPHSNCTIEGNWITGCDIGINLVGFYNCTFIRNELLDNRDDIFLTTGHSNNFSGNNIGKLVWSTAFLVPGENYFDGNYWGEYEGVDDNGDGFGDTPFKVYWIDYGDRNITCYDNHTLMKPTVISESPDTNSPTISIVSLENKTYPVNNFSLTFTVSEPTSWIGYSLDRQTNVTITGNTTLTGLPDGPHNLVVYAKDNDGNTGASEIIYFSIVSPPPDLNGEIFLITNWIFWGMIIIVTIAVVGGLYFSKKRKPPKQTVPTAPSEGIT